MAQIDEPLALILSNKWDISVDFVVREFRRRGARFVRLNTEDLPGSESCITLPELSFVVPFCGASIDLQGRLTSVWLRRPGKPFSACFGGPENTSVAARYSQDQWHAFIEGLLALDKVLWINNPRANDTMESKIVQLCSASRLGFRIPRTCITSSKTKAMEFLEACGGRVVVKALYAPLLEFPEQDYFIFSEVVRDFSKINTDEIGASPFIIQEHLFPKRDYRVTVVGDRVLSARIESAEGRPVPLDWRTEKEGLNFRESPLPPAIEDKCRRLARENGLVFGAIDLLEVNGEFYFLEINPNGEWGWLQTCAGLPIAEAICDCLLGKAG